MNQNTHQDDWSADDRAQDSLFATAASPEILEGVNLEALREAVSEVSDDLFGPSDTIVEVGEAVVEDELYEAQPRASTGVAFFGDATSTTPPADETVVMPRSKVQLMQALLRTIQESSQRIADLLGGQEAEEDARAFLNRAHSAASESAESGAVIEGVFNGHAMIGPDGKQYNMPSNYASKSKLVEGDILKLTILPSGKFIYKQIGPLERIRVIGTLVGGVGGEYCVEKDGTRWKILTASVTYFKGNHGDEAVVLVPKHGESTWAAVENIMNKH